MQTILKYRALKFERKIFTSTILYVENINQKEIQFETDIL